MRGERPRGHIQGIDGKYYRARPLDADSRARLVGRVHYLSHDEGLSVRKIVARLQEQGVRLSVGSVSNYLNVWTCEGCSGGVDGSPEHSEMPAIVAG